MSDILNFVPSTERVGGLEEEEAERRGRRGYLKMTGESYPRRRLAVGGGGAHRGQEGVGGGLVILFFWGGGGARGSPLYLTVFVSLR